LKTLLILVFVGSVLYCKPVLDFSKEVIQVGVFSKQKSIDRLKVKLKTYNIFTKKYSNSMIKAFVINIPKKNLQTTLASIKKVVPKAFVLSQSAKKRLFQKKIEIEQIVPSNDGINSKTIIKATKKYF